MCTALCAIALNCLDEIFAKICTCPLISVVEYCSISGLRQFSATLRSRVSLKSEDDLPPPYDSIIANNEQSTETNDQQSPPMYHVAISMTSETHNPQQVESNFSTNDNLENINSESESDTDDRDEVLVEDETDSKVNFAAKKVRSPKSPKIS